MDSATPAPAAAPGPAGGSRPLPAHHKQTMSFALKPDIIEALKKRSGSHSEYITLTTRICLPTSGVP